MKRNLSITVNGTTHANEIDEGMTLLEYLRDELGLTGTKEGCGKGACGACTVLVNGNAVNSCLFLAINADGARVTTIEGLAEEGMLHPLQQAFIDENAIQCGFCTPGMIMSALALLHKQPHPSEEEIQKAISGNICRCTGYYSIIKAIKLAADRCTAAGFNT